MAGPGSGTEQARNIPVWMGKGVLQVPSISGESALRGRGSEVRGWGSGDP